MCYFRQLCCFITSSNSFYHIRNIKSIKKFFTTKNRVCFMKQDFIELKTSNGIFCLVLFMKIFALLTLFIKFDRHGKMFIASKSRVSKTCHIHIHLLYCLGRNNFYLTKPFFQTEKCFA